MSAPVWGRELKYRSDICGGCRDWSAPVWGRELKFSISFPHISQCIVGPRVGP